MHGISSLIFSAIIERKTVNYYIQIFSLFIKLRLGKIKILHKTTEFGDIYMFKLPLALEQDCLFIKDLSLSSLLLKNDARFLWLILVPRRENVTEIFELTPVDQNLLFSEIMELSPLLKSFNNADKLNIGALGNIVPALHIHMIGRHKADPLWPNPVWGMGEATPYSKEESQVIIQKLRKILP